MSETSTFRGRQSSSCLGKARILSWIRYTDVCRIGDQHNPKHPTANPYEDVKSHVSEYTAQEIATLSSRLEKQLGPEYISTRPGASGTKVPYLAADKCINLANEVFGFNGWSSGIQQIQIDFVRASINTGRNKGTKLSRWTRVRVPARLALDCPS